MVSGASLGSAVLKLSTDAGAVDKGFDRVERTALKRTRDIGTKMTMAITEPILGIGTAIFGATNTVQEALKIIRVGTGATGKALQGLRDDFDAVWGSVPGSARDAAVAIADLNTKLELTGEPLRAAARQALQFASIFDVGVKATIEDVSRAMEIFGEDSANFSSILDRLTVASQQTGAGVDKLAFAVKEYGPVLHTLGFTLDDTTALFANFQAGVADISRVSPALNQFLQRLAKEGVTDLKGALVDTVEQIRSTDDASRGAALARIHRRRASG